MAEYEMIFITAPSLTDDETDEVASQMEILVRERGATLRVEKWGKRRLAYEIKHHEDGYFYLFEMETQADVIQELERRMKLDDKVLRFLTVRVDEEKRRAKKLAAARGTPVEEAVEAAAAEEPAAEETAPPAEETKTEEE
jgi:small subunit ribosomal protein S6